MQSEAKPTDWELKTGASDVNKRIFGILRAAPEICADTIRLASAVGLSGPVFSVSELAEAGVRRISVGGSFARAAWGGLMRAAQEVRNTGTFTYAAEALPGSVIAALMSPDKRGGC